MVYAVRSNRTFVSKKPLKTKRKVSPREAVIDNFVKTHRVSVYTDASGNVIVDTAEKINE